MTIMELKLPDGTTAKGLPDELAQFMALREVHRAPITRRVDEPPPNIIHLNEVVKTSLALLEYLEKGNQPKIGEMMALLGVSNEKGVGPKTGAINRYLLSLGFNSSDVFITDKVPGGDRWWKAGPRVQEALVKIRSAEGAQDT